MSKDTGLSAARRHAYRVLLYASALETRHLTWFRYRGLRRALPYVTQQESQAIRCAGAVAYWLHNLAMFSAREFEEFNEEEFWSGLQVVAKDFPETATAYRQIFDRAISEWPDGQGAAILAIVGPGR